MRVLHLYSGNLYGGIESLLAVLARERGLCPAMDPTFALCFEGRLSRELAGAGVEVHQLGAVRLTRPGTVRRARLALDRLLAARPMDVLVSHAPWVNAVFGPVLRDASTPLVQWLHNPLTGTWLDRWSRRTTPRLLICNSRYTASTAGAGFPGVPTVCLYYPVHVASPRLSDRERAEIRQACDTPSEATVIVQASRLEAWKGHRVLLEALGTLSARPGWVLWILGGAQRPFEVRYRTDLERLAERCGIAERVRFLGERDDVPRVLSAADLYCQPNLEPEPFGIVFVEALAAGLPVVATDMGGPAEVVEPSCGRLVPAGDPVALAATLDRLLREPDTRRALGSAGPGRAREVSDPATQMQRLATLLSRVAGRRPATASPEPVTPGTGDR